MPSVPEAQITVEAPVTDAGFAGLGIMGSALSGHLLAAGWQVTGYDIDPARTAEHEWRGVLPAVPRDLPGS